MNKEIKIRIFEPEELKRIPANVIKIFGNYILPNDAIDKMIEKIGTSKLIRREIGFVQEESI